MTQKKKKLIVNDFFLSQMTRAGKEYEVIEGRKHKGLSPIDLPTVLFENGKISQLAKDGVTLYKSDFSISEIDDFKKMNWGNQTGRAKDRSDFLQIKVNASLKVHKIKNILMQKSLARYRNLKYLDILNLVIESQASAPRIEKMLKINYAKAKELLAEVCEIIGEFYSNE